MHLFCSQLLRSNGVSKAQGSGACAGAIPVPCRWPRSLSSCIQFGVLWESVRLSDISHEGNQATLRYWSRGPLHLWHGRHIGRSLNEESCQGPHNPDIVEVASETRLD